MRRRAPLLEFAVLGLLHDSPMHGYELRKRLNAALGAFRALSYGTLYPCLRRLLDARLIAQRATEPTIGKRAKIVYELTATGKEHFQDLASRADSTAYDDDGFDVRLAFFTRTEADVRLRILEGRRSRLEERLHVIRDTAARNRERLDRYTSALQRHGEDNAEREVRWLSELIDAERLALPQTPRPASDPLAASADAGVPIVSQPGASTHPAPTTTTPPGVPQPPITHLIKE